MDRRTRIASCSALLLVLSVSLAALSGCYRLQGSSGGGQTDFEPPRIVRAADVALPEGYRIEPVAVGFTFPTGVAFDDQGRPYVTEAGYSYGEVFTTPRLVRVEEDGQMTEVAAGDQNGPWNGLTYHDGEVTPIVEGLSSLGDHHTNGPVVGPDGWLYFGQGTATNAAAVGPDNADFGWLRRYPDFHDVPCRDALLTGQGFESANPLTPDGDRVTTGPTSPSARPRRKGRSSRARCPAAAPCCASVPTVARRSWWPGAFATRMA